VSRPSEFQKDLVAFLYRRKRTILSSIRWAIAGALAVDRSPARRRREMEVGRGSAGEVLARLVARGVVTTHFAHFSPQALGQKEK